MKSDHVAPKQNGSHFLGTIATEQQVDEIGEGTDQLLRIRPNPTRFLQVARPKTVGTRCRTGWECADRLKYLSRGHLPRPGCVRGGKSSEGSRIGVKRMFLHQQLEILLVRYRRRRPIAQNSDGCSNITVLKLRIYCREQCPFSPQRPLSARGTSPSNLRLRLGGSLHSRRRCAL